MCGIFGIISKSGPVLEAQVRELTDLVSHRGPDGSGVYSHRNVGLGHRRLAIIDLSQNGAQPMRHTEQPVWITFNGEIYNHVELRSELESLGLTFMTATDTEVLLNAYLTWGPKCLDRFNGMWAFAILDQRDNTLFCARDRFGVKPFYYVETTDAFAFGSEIRQLLPFIDKRQADEELVNDFLVCGLTDHTTRTFFKGIRKLAPGHLLRADIATGDIKIECFYRLAPSKSAGEVSIDKAPTLLRNLLDESVSLRLRSDVRVGTCLSGGLDSSSVATLAAAKHANQSNNKFCAITAISEQASNNEEIYAARVVETCGLNWIQTLPTYEEFSSQIKRLIDVQEEPFGGPSIMMQYEVMKAARANGVIVLLDGQGGDETLLGYERYYAAWLLEHFRDQGISGFLAAFRSALSVNANLSLLRLLVYLIGASTAAARSFGYRWRYGFLKNISLPESLRRFARNTRDAAAMQILEITETNLPMLLRFEDKNSMHFGIETRLPFLDYRFVEFALGLSARIKLNGGWTKWPLRKAMTGSLPQDICWRQDKIGFAAPDQIWLNRHLPAMREKVLGNTLIAKHVDLKALTRRFDRLDLGMCWRLYCLALWSEQFKVND